MPQGESGDSRKELVDIVISEHVIRAVQQLEDIVYLDQYRTFLQGQLDWVKQQEQARLGLSHSPP